MGSEQGCDNMNQFKKICLFSTLLLVSEIGFITPMPAADFIADYSKAKESVLRSIPVQYINAAKSNLHIMYCGTSHSSQTADGLRGLMQYKSGDDTLFAVTFNGTPAAGSLDIHYRPEPYYSNASDLSHDAVDENGHTAYFRETVSYLDNAAYSDVNVVMWSWCSIEGHDVQIYLDNFEELINMYKAGGTKGRTQANEVKFVFMTGYARGSDGDTPEPPYIRSPYQNHKRIADFCNANGYFCLDYWSQDVYHYETDAYKPTESGNDNVQHKEYFDSHTQGVHWFATMDYSSGTVKWPAHCEGTPQHITSNRRAYAAWWIWARLAGWSGENNLLVYHGNDYTADNKADIAVYRPSNGYWYVRGGSNVRWGIQPGDIPVPGDYNGDGTTDIAVYRPSNGYWYIRGVGNYRWGIQYGDIPVPGDYNKNGKTDIAVYRPSNGYWYIRGVGNYRWGIQPGDIPVPGDYNKDGKTDIAIYRPSNGTWYIKDVGNYVWGIQPGDVPVPGDYNNDGTTDIAVYRPSNGYWYIRGIGNYCWGIQAGDIPVPGDYDGNGTTDIAIYRHSNGYWYIRGGAYIRWGIQSEDIPVQADYNGDGKFEIAVFRPSTGTWYIRGIGNYVWGKQVGDIPVTRGKN